MGEKRPYKNWTSAEIEDIRLNYPQGGVGACKIALRRHTKRGIASEANLLGVRMRRRVLWTERESSMVSKFYPDGGTPAFIVPGKTRNHICAKASRMGIRRTPETHGSRWTEREDDIIRRLYPSGGRHACIAKLPGRTIEAIKTRAKVMSARREEFVNLWTDREDNLIRQIYPEGGRRAVRELLPHRTATAIKWRIKKLGVRRT